MKYGKACVQSIMQWLNYGEVGRDHTTWSLSYCMQLIILNSILHTSLIKGGTEDGMYKLVMKQVLWWFLQCVETFKHCRPVMSVDATFLTGKYKATMMIAIGIVAKDQLLSIAFGLAGSENNDCWSWLIIHV